MTTFNRGLSGVDDQRTTTIRGDRTVPADLARLQGHTPWDAVIDTSGYVPANQLQVCRALERHTARYVFASTVSVYSGWPKVRLTEDSDVLYCPSDAGPDYGTNVEDGPTQYGYQKSGCERAVYEVFGTNSTSLRPGVVLGPHEYVGRLPWWLNRISRGGTVVAPGKPDRSIQPIDVRDLAEFAVLCASSSMRTTYNVAAPMGRDSFEGFLNACISATGSTAVLEWIPDDTLLSLGIRQWSELPLWRTFDGTWKVVSDKALADGLECRPLELTVRDTWSWMKTTRTDDDNERSREIGLSAQKEQAVLANAS